MTHAEIAPVAPEVALRRPAALQATPHPFAFVLVKLASRCNINCTYCYWFRDAQVYEKPAVLTLEAEDAFCLRLEEHIREFNLPVFLLVFHGGEPLLFPKRRFDALQKKLRDIEQRTGCVIKRGVTTNGILVDEEWVELFKTHDVDVTVSLDGPADINDKYRVDFKGRGTLAQTLQGLERLRAARLEPGLISVCNPGTDPERVLAFVADELGMKQFDILPPDATHADNPPPIADYFIKLFDVLVRQIRRKRRAHRYARRHDPRPGRAVVALRHHRLGPDRNGDAHGRRLARAARCAPHCRGRFDGVENPCPQPRHQGR